MVDFDFLEKKLDSLNMKSEIMNQGKSAILSLTNSFYDFFEPKDFENVVITGAGDKYLIGLLAGTLWNSLSQIPINVFHSREIAELKPRSISNKTLMILLSQSGKTKDTLSALEVGKRRGAQIVGITNNASGFKGVTHNLKTSVVERALPSTGTFHSITAVLFNYFLSLLGQTGLMKKYLSILEEVDKQSKSDKIISWAKNESLKYSNENYFYVLGDGPRYAIARKTALIMMMEGAKTNAFPLRTEEFIHSLIETLEVKQQTPLILLKPDKRHVSREFSETIKLIERMWKKKIVIKSDNAHNILSAQLQAVPLEWFSYYSALIRNVNPGLGRLVKKVRG